MATIAPVFVFLDFGLAFDVHKHAMTTTASANMLVSNPVHSKEVYKVMYARACDCDLAFEAISRAGQGIFNSPKAGACRDCTVQPQVMCYL